MIHLKACKRCGGDLTENIDKDGLYLQCLQCGRQEYPELLPPDTGAKDGWRMKNKKGKL